MKTLILSVGYMLLLLSCHGSTTSKDSTGMENSRGMPPAMEESQAYDKGQSSEVEITDQQIIRNGSMNIKVDDALKTKTEVDTIIKRRKAYAGNEQFDNTDYSANYHIQIRIPAENLDALVSDLEALDGTVTYKSINSRDVTEEFIDLETRLANKRAYLEQYRQLLKNAHSIEDIMKVREQIRALEEEIESVEGRLKYLRNQVSLSTLDLTLTQEKAYIFRPDRKINFFERLKDSLSTGWYGFVEFSLALIGLWPFWILVILVIWLLRKYSKRRSKVIPPKG
ncbi:MAG TPA: DUF4349 domain-containing protein [Saprospiraceae bacterium]|nr:DUF4349 domain-containing protein [Saprospiraceae bacterium]